MRTAILWKQSQQHLSQVPELGLTLDISRMRFEDGLLDLMATPMRAAFEAIDALERGAIANPDEKRRVAHYWLRAPDLAPSPAIAAEIRGTLAAKKATASILALQGKILVALAKAPQSAEQIATAAGAPDAAETVYFLLRHLAASGRARSCGFDAPGQMTFSKS